MQKREYISFLFSLISFLAFGQSGITNDSSVQLIPHWKQGDLFKVKTTYSSEETINGQVIRYSSELFADVKVLKSSRKDYTIEWTYTKMNISNRDNLVENQIKGASKNLKLVYRISDIGQFLELLNYEEVKKTLTSIFDTLKIRFSNDPDLNLSFQRSRQIFLTRQGAEILLMKDIKLFHFPLGYEYQRNKTFTNSLKIPNIFGGVPFEATERVQLTRINLYNTTCVIETNKTVDPVNLKSELISYLKKLAKENNQIMNDDFKNDKLEFSESTYHETDYVKGLVKIGLLTRIIKLGVQNKTSTTKVELID